MSGTVNIGVGHIHPHPDNPRKDLGDLTELVESIKKNGVMQNLTVIPQEGSPGEYTAIIGHRRHAAAKLAGISELPCIIKDSMSKKEQVSIMLEENIQRNDLTIFEQAHGFQMMLDLGETEDSIAEKTGFSKTTIKHRLNIAKLDQEELQKKECDDSFQLTLRDLYELEKVKDIKSRNKILKESSNSRDLVNRAHDAVAKAKRTENAKSIISMLKKAGVKKAPKEIEDEQWSSKLKILKEFELDKDAPKRITLPKGEGQRYYIVWYRKIRVIEKAQKEKRELAPWEQEQKRKDKIKRQIRAVLNESSARRRELIQNIISGKVDAVKDEAGEVELVWAALIQLETFIYGSMIRRFFLTKNEYNCTDAEKDEARKKADGLSMLHQMLITLDVSMANVKEITDYNLKFNPAKGSALLKGYEALEPYGWYFESEDEKKVLEGTYELYERES